MNRREFMGAGMMTIGAVAAPGALHAEAAAIETYAAGDFLVYRTGRALAVSHAANPGRAIFETADGNFLSAEQATADIRDFGSPQGSFDISDRITAAYDEPSIDAIEAQGPAIVVSGRLQGAKSSIGYRLSFEPISRSRLGFRIAVEGAGKDPVNRIRLRIGSALGEAFFGFGQQLTDFNQKGNLLPILVQEHGVGRGQPIVTQAVDLMADNGGGTPYTTEAPAPHYLSSRLRSFYLENLEYSTFDLRAAAHVEVKVWSGTMVGGILHGQTPLELIEAYTEYCGRMRPLPDWIHDGLIIGTQGGTEIVRGKLATAREAGIPVAALWLQDWPGIRVTNVGKQLWWDWKLDQTQYPGWQDLLAELGKDGVRMLLYINPFLSIEEGHDSLYREGVDKGFLVRNEDGTPFLNRNTNFSAAMVDLSNPDARTWIKGVMKREMIEKAGASGWMNDFGEALPFDGKLHDGADPHVWHNRYAAEWAKVAREAIEEAGRGDDIVFFDRSGFTQSPGAATLFWLGDQIQDWSAFDGIKTAVVGLLSGGVSGFSLNHSDTGGYVAFKFSLAGKEIPLIARSEELLMRWTELNAFTAVLRGHEGLAPDVSAQFDSSKATLEHTARFAKLFKALGAYRKTLVAEAATKGYPLCRALFLHYPDDPNTYEVQYQFLLGRDLMVAPVLDKGATTVEVYFPLGDEWTDLWSGADAGKAGHWRRMPAPIGKPAVFLRKGAPAGPAISEELRAAGLL